jgi:branched-chain amino acid transport system substrate-binding protein
MSKLPTIRSHYARRFMLTGTVFGLVLTMALGAGAGVTAGASSSTFGKQNVAKGSVLTVGYITDGQNGSIDNLSEVPAAKAATKYINKYLGGVGGHVLALDVCNDQGTPSGATDCVNQLITAKVPVVLNNTSADNATIYAGLSAAGIPYVSAYSSVTAQLTGKLSYILTNGLAADFAGPAALAAKVKAKRAALFVINVPAAAGPAQAIDPIIFKAAGVPVDVVPIPSGTPDMTPQIEAEISKGVNFIQVLGDPSFCTSALKAAKTLDYSGTVALIAQCIDASSASGIPGGYKGDMLLTSSTTDPTNPDVKLYKAVMAKFAKGTSPFANGVTAGGYLTVLSFARAMTGLTGATTSADIETAFATAAPKPLVFGQGGTFQCNGKQVTVTPAVCSSVVLSAKLNQSGNPVGKFTSVQTAALLKGL